MWLPNQATITFREILAIYFHLEGLLCFLSRGTWKNRGSEVRELWTQTCLFHLKCVHLHVLFLPFYMQSFFYVKEWQNSYLFWCLRGINTWMCEQCLTCMRYVLLCTCRCTHKNIDSEPPSKEITLVSTVMPLVYIWK